MLGSGFGLYGYLPAIVSLGYTNIFCPERYRRKLLSRSDIQKFDNSIEWVNDDEAVLGTCNTLFIAKRPVDQFAILSESNRLDGLKGVFLEKPLAPSAELAQKAVQALANQRVRIGSGMFFDKLGWAKKLLAKHSQKTGRSNTKIEWQFNAHHYTNDLHNWKREVSQGGGALKYYGIHLVALLSALGYARVIESRLLGTEDGGATTWEALFENTRGDTAKVVVASNQPSSLFHVDHDDTSVAHLTNPFQECETQQGSDARIPVLRETISSFLIEQRDETRQVTKVVELWSQIEQLHDRQDNDHQEP